MNIYIIKLREDYAIAQGLENINLLKGDYTLFFSIYLINYKIYINL